MVAELYDFLDKVQIVRNIRARIDELIDFFILA